MKNEDIHNRFHNFNISKMAYIEFSLCTARATIAEKIEKAEDSRQNREEAKRKRNDLP